MIAVLPRKWWPPQKFFVGFVKAHMASHNISDISMQPQAMHPLAHLRHKLMTPPILHATPMAGLTSDGSPPLGMGRALACFYPLREGAGGGDVWGGHRVCGGEVGCVVVVVVYFKLKSFFYKKKASV